MHKLLALVLSVSILVSSITPALGQVGPVGRSVVKGFRQSVPAVTNRNLLPSRLSTQITRQVTRQSAALSATNWVQSRMVAGQVNGLAHQILQKPVALRAPILRSDFITLSLMPGAVSASQRAQAVQAYQSQLKDAQQTLAVAQTDLNTFLSYAKQHMADPKVTAVRDVLADASALGLVGTQESAGVLVDFYNQAQGTLFEDTAALITARGLLRMRAYTELEQFLNEHADKELLAGTATYIRMNGLPVEVPAQLQIDISQAANEELAAFLGSGFLFNRIHADISAAATEQWMSLKAPRIQGIEPAEVPETPNTDKPLSQTDIPMAAQGTDPVSKPTGNIPTLVLSPLQVTPSNATPAAVTTPAPAAVTPRATSSSSGILYSGIPVFAIADLGKRFFSWMGRKFKKESVPAATYEEPGLHERNMRTVYAQADVPERAQIGGDLVGAAAEPEMVAVGLDGFKLTVEGEDKVEHILHNVDVTVSATLKNFSPEYNRLALDTNYFFELRNQTVPAKRPDHFYFALSTQNGELNALLSGARQLDLSRPLRIKIQRTGAPKRSVTLPVYDKNLKEPPVLLAEVDSSLLSGIADVEQGHIWYYNGALYFCSKDGELTELENAFVRLPKAESKHWTQILAMYPNTQFRLGVFSTMEKMIPVTYLVPSLQIGLGKTLAPALHDMSTLSKDDASNIMLGINNVLPALMGLVHPLLKQYGEAAVFRVGASMFSAGGLIALASGLYGHVAGGMMTNWQLAGFLTSSVLIALGTNVTRFVQNLLMSANRGIVPQSNSFQKEVTVEQAEPVVYGAKHLAKRTWEVLTKKSPKSLRDVVYYQRGAMFKNLGTMLFLSLPWMANLAGRAVGVELGLDFSASYVPYTLYSLYTLRKVYKTRYKDAFPMNMTVLTNNLQDLQNSTAVSISKVAPSELTSTHPVLVAAAKQLKGAIDALVPVEARQLKTGINGLTIKHETEVGEELENLLLLSGRTPQEAQAARQNLQQAFDVLGRRDVKLYKVAAMKGLPTSLAAMTLATFGELGLSNGLAFAMREMIGNGTAATGIVGILLYGCMFGWRIVGNIISQRMSGGSMYALSSAAGIAGPAMMAAAMQSGNMGLLVTGAVTACFGISNFFSQMYEYMVGLYPKYKREIALLINYTMPVAAIPVGGMKSGAFEALGIPGLDMAVCGAALAASVVLTPGMLANSSLVQTAKYSWQKLKSNIQHFLRRGGNGDNTGNMPPVAEAPAN